MASPNFIKKVQEQVEAIREDYPGIASQGDAFAVWALSFLHDLDLDAAVDACSISGPNDQGIDAVYIDEDNWKVYILQAKYSENASKNYGVDPWRELFTGYATLLNDRHSAKLGAEFATIAAQVRSAVSAGAQVVLEVVLFGNATNALQQSVNAFSSDSQRSSDSSLQLSSGFLYTVDNLEQLDQDKVNFHDLRGVTVDFDLAEPIIKVKAPVFDGLSEYYLAILDAHRLGEVAARYKAQLVDWNVRYRLSNSSINKAIASTILSAENRNKFVLLNNGITMVCKRIEPGKETVRMLNPQIVNGAQTALTLSANLSSFEAGEAQVLARIAVVKDDDSGDQIAREIAESTNRQNPVTAADLKSQDALQRRIEYQLSILSPEPWYYERRKNSYSGISESEKNRFKGRKLTKENAGQRFRAMIGEPAAAIRQKNSIFDDPKLYGRIFSADIDVANYLLADALYQLFYDLLAGNTRCEKARNSLYNGFDEEMRKLLSKARNLWASHGSALAFWLLQKKYGTLSHDRTMVAANGIRQVISSLEDGVPNPYVPLVKYVVSVIIKWVKTQQQNALKSNEPLNIKDAFQGTGSGHIENALAELKIESEMISQFVGDPLESLPD